MASVKRHAGRIRVVLRPEERMIVSGFAREVADLLGGPVAPDPDPLAAMVGMPPEPGAGAPQRPTDPALLRLLPDAYADDPGGSAEFRRFTDDELRRGKAALLVRLADDIDAAEQVELTDEQADGWVQALNDIRLVLAARLGVDDDDGTWRTTLSRDDERLPLVAAYDWLAGLQERLLDALT
jgi:hypothetical protein